MTCDGLNEPSLVESRMLANFDMVRYPEGHLDECLRTLHSYIKHTEDAMTRLTLFNHDDVRRQITHALAQHAKRSSHTETDTTFTHVLDAVNDAARLINDAHYTFLTLIGVSPQGSPEVSNIDKLIYNPNRNPKTRGSRGTASHKAMVNDNASDGMILQLIWPVWVHGASVRTALSA